MLNIIHCQINTPNLADSNRESVMNANQVIQIYKEDSQILSSSVIELPQTNRLKYLHAKMRDKVASKSQFIFYADQVFRLLIEKSLELVPFKDLDVTTPVGKTYKGKQFADPICAVSVVRAGESMENELRHIDLKIPIGKILIQRDVVTKLPTLYYSKLPDHIAKCRVLIFEPMLATGGSAICAIQVLIDAGVLEENIIFVNLLCSPEGIQKVTQQFKKIQIVTSSIEEYLNGNAFMIPGIGDFGDRYFGTTDVGAV
ncbi:uracil phosphoribosyltransferase [Pseudoalteromonas fuliginea]|uniref:Uracil phosphoribosyltransferase n=2 Tax=Pseudoalteromonas fuliginea TaxID=1872678 RepID=A0ABQ6RJC6_9GAMM|nr:uracil phosphoribosyltransferase [Pseudoalteromonas fuliginea]KAA1167838.1 uracil phosphoribosyltransferase [Pseudoalteromonas fuliginea]